MTAGASTHPSRRQQVPPDHPHKKRKTAPTDEHGKRPFHHRRLEKKTRPLNPLKSRIRALERTLRRHADAETPAATLPADVRLAHERELASCRFELREAEEHERKKKMIGKWHMVRFFGASSSVVSPSVGMRL